METDKGASVTDLCRHEPLVRVTAFPPGAESYFTACRKCERIITVNVLTGKVRAA